VREFSHSYVGSGGSIWSVTPVSSTLATNFVYQVRVYCDDWTKVGNLETDLNAVLSNGQLQILAFQTDGYAKAFDWTKNKGTVDAPVVSWIPSNVAVNLRAFPAKTWISIEYQTSYDPNTGICTFHNVALNGVVSPMIGCSGLSLTKYIWAKNIVQTQFQIDGLGASGSNTIYAANMNLAYW